MTTPTRKLWFCLAVSFLANACTYTNAGGGSQTLEVQAVMRFNSQARAGGSPTTQVQIQLDKNGQPVASPTITLTDADTNQTYTVTSAGGGGKTFNAAIPGYHRRVALSITSGSDNLQVHLEGPGPFTLASPVQNAQITESGGLNVTWDTEDGVKADQVSVVLASNGVKNVGHDSGTYVYPASALILGPTTVAVTRSNFVVPAGATGSSQFEIDYEVDVSFTVNP